MSDALADLRARHREPLYVLLRRLRAKSTALRRYLEMFCGLMYRPLAERVRTAG